MSALQDLEIVVTGCIIVMAVLALLWGLMVGVGRLVALGHALQARFRPAAAVETAKAAPAIAAAGIPSHHLVAIAAAVDVALGVPHRIVGISAPAHRVAGWAASGRHRRPDFRPAGASPLNKRTDGS